MEFGRQLLPVYIYTAFISSWTLVKGSSRYICVFYSRIYITEVIPVYPFRPSQLPLRRIRMFPVVCIALAQHYLSTDAKASG